MLVHEKVAERFVELLVDEDAGRGPTATRWTRKLDMGTVIDEPAAKLFEARVNDAVAQGARLLVGNERARRAVLAHGDRPRRPGDDRREARRRSARSRR